MSKEIPDPTGSQPFLVYYWIASYDDDTYLYQFDPKTGEENKYSDIDQDALKAIGFYPFSKEFAELVRSKGVKAKAKPLPHYRVDLLSNQRPIVIRRNIIAWMHGKNPQVKSREIVYLLGWQATIGGKNVKAVMHIHEDGCCELLKP